MAAVKISPVRISGYNEATEALISSSMFTALDATDGAVVDIAKSDANQTVLLIQNSNSSADKTLTVKGGTGHLSSGQDMEIAVAKGTTCAVVLEDGEFGNGRTFVLSGAADIKILAIELP